MTEAITSPATQDHTISDEKGLWASSCPPLNPIENNKYRLMNFAVEAGISKSLLIRTAMIPSKKNSKVGFVRFEIRI